MPLGPGVEGDVRASLITTGAVAAGVVALWRVGAEILDDLHAELDPNLPQGFEDEQPRPAPPAYDRTL